MHSRIVIRKLLHFFCFLLTSYPLFVFSQDIIEKKNGEQLKTRIIKVDKKTVVYKAADDPEFGSKTVEKKDLKSVQFDNGKKIVFDENRPKPYLAFAMGPSVALSDLRSKNIEDSKYEPGYMTNGLFARFDGGFYFKKNIGIAIQSGGMNFKYNKEAVLNDAANGMEDSQVEVHYYEQNDSTKESNVASFNIFSVGLLYSRKLGERHTLDVGAMVGRNKMGERSLWEQKTFYPDDPTLTTHVSKVYDTPSAGVWSLGAAYRLNLTDQWALRANLDFYSGSIKRSYNIQSQGAGAVLFTDGTNTNYLRFQALNLGIGIVFQFNRKNS